MEIMNKIDYTSLLQTCLSVVVKIVQICQTAKKNLEVFAYIQSRIQALEPSLKNLQQRKQEIPALYNIRKHLCDVYTFTQKLEKRGKLSKIWNASNDAQTLNELNDKLTQCETDLNLVLNAELKIQLDSVQRMLQNQDKYINRLLQDLKKISLNEIPGSPDLVVQQLATVFNKDTQEVLQYWYQKHEDILNNLIANLDAKLQKLSDQFQQGFNQIQNQLNKMCSFCKNEEAKQFVSTYFNNNFSLPWTSFYAALVHGCFQNKNLQESPQLREQLKILVDKNNDDSIDVSEIDLFFTSVWNNQQKMNQLKQLSNQQTQQPQQYYQTKAEIEEASIIEFNLESLNQSLPPSSLKPTLSASLDINNIKCINGHLTQRIFNYGHYINFHGSFLEWSSCDKCRQNLFNVGFSFHCCLCKYDL